MKRIFISSMRTLHHMALTMIKSYLKPREFNHLTVGKEKIEGEICCAVTFGMFLYEKEYEQLKKFAKSADIFNAIAAKEVAKK